MKKAAAFAMSYLATHSVVAACEAPRAEGLWVPRPPARAGNPGTLLSALRTLVGHEKLEA